MIDQALLEKYFLKHEPSPDNLVRLAKFIYEKASFHNQKLLSTDYFIKIVKTVAGHLQMSNVQIQSILFKLYDVILAYRTRGGQRVRVARLKSPLMIRKIVRELWFRTMSKAVRPRPLIYQKMILRRMTAMQTLIASVTGRRWIDITRLRWEYANILYLEHAIVIKIGIFISKPNKKGRRNESITLVKDNTDLCPVKLLIQYWILMGKPKSGWIFPCVHKSAKFRKNGLCDQWSAYCCQPGHRRGGKRIECIGFVDGDTTEGMMKRTSLKVGFKTPPTKHTFRRNLVVMALKLGMNRERVCEHFGWNFDTHMIAHYIQDELGTDKDGLPCQIANNMLSKNMLKEILFTE